MKKKIILVFIGILFSWAYSNASEIERLSPAKKSTVNLGKSVEFSVKISEPKGLTYTEWFVNGISKKKKIATGFNKNDSWSYSFNKTGIQIISIATHNLEGGKSIISWLVNVKDKKTKKVRRQARKKIPKEKVERKNKYITVVSPKDEYQNLFINSEKEMIIEMNDNNCDLKNVEWYINDKLIENQNISGCTAKVSFKHIFNKTGYFRICANLFNIDGFLEASCWTFKVTSEKEIDTDYIWN